MKWLKLSIMSVGFIFSFCFITSIVLADTNVSCDEMARRQGIDPSNCRSCSCSGIRAQTAYPSCDADYGTLSCLDYSLNDMFTPYRDYCHGTDDYPSQCGQWMFPDTGPYTCDLTHVQSGVDHAEWSYHVCWNGSSWNNSPKATYGSGPAPSPPTCTRRYFGCGLNTCAPTQNSWQDSCGNSGCQTQSACTLPPTATPIPPTPTPIPTNTPTPTPTPTPIPGRITMHVVAGQYCSPNIKLTWLQLIKDSDGLQKDQLNLNQTLTPNQSYNGTFTNYSCVAGDYYRVRARYSYPATNPTTSDIWDYAIECPSYEGFSIPCPSPIPTATPTPDNPTAYGENQGIDSTGGRCDLVGWACDESIVDAEIGVDLYADGSRGAGTYLGRVTAREDGNPPAAQGYCQDRTNHGYRFSLPSSYHDAPASHTIYAYAIGINNSGAPDGNNPGLIGNFQEFTCGNPPVTPTQGPWAQLNSTSFRGASGLTSKIPLTPAPFSGIGVGQPNFIIGSTIPLRDAGAVTAPGIDLGTLNPSAAVSAKKWSNSSYSGPGVSIDSSIEYIKAKKSFVNVNTLDDINAQKINIFTNTTITINSAADGDKMYGATKTGPNTPIMIILQNSNLIINIAQFNPSNNPIVILASKSGGPGSGSTGKITFSSTTSSASGIFIAETVDTGTNANLGLQIQGNLITNSLINNRKWALGNNARPSLYVVNDMGMYIQLLPFLSKSTSEWTQLQ